MNIQSETTENGLTTIVTESGTIISFPEQTKIIRRRNITKKEFFNLFTSTQREAIHNSTNVKVKDWIFMINLEKDINTDDSTIITGLNKLEDPLNILEAGEANRIITEMQTLAEV